MISSMAGIFEAIHFRMMNHAAALHALVMSTPDDFSVANQHRADGNAAFSQTFPGFVNCSLEKLIHAVF